MRETIGTRIAYYRFSNLRMNESIENKEDRNQLTILFEHELELTTRESYLNLCHFKV